MPIVVMGPPGAGKSTQAARLSSRLSIPHISTGEVLRAEIAAGSALGLDARRRIDEGEFMPDAIMDDMISNRIDALDCRDGFILDGYPRTLAQANAFEDVMEEMDLQIRAVLVFDIPHEVAMERILGRARDDGAEARKDDTETVVGRRIAIHDERTAPIVDLYERQCVLERIDGTASIESITEEILLRLAPRDGRMDVS